jgi:hypothetical protein
MNKVMNNKVFYRKPFVKDFIHKGAKVILYIAITVKTFFYHNFTNVLSKKIA